MPLSNILGAGKLVSMTSLFAPAFFALFLPFCIITYALVPKKLKKYFLLVASYGFFWFVQHPQRIFSANVIYETVWNEMYTYSANSTIMVHIRKLRTKIEDDPQNPVYIKNVWGKGYRYEEDKRNF